MIFPWNYFSTLSLVVTLLLLYLYNWYRRPKHFPPGPRGIPLLGVLPFLGKYPEKTFKHWSKKYGSILSVRFGPKDIVVVNDFNSIQQTLVKQPTKFSGRPYFEFFHQITGGLGIAFADYGDHWKTQRKFGLVTLREFGMGKLSLETKLIEEVSYLSDAIRNKNGKPFDINRLFLNSVTNIICGIGFGRRYEYDDAYFTDVLHRFIRSFEDPFVNAYLLLVTFCPFLTKVPPFFLYNRKLMRIVDDVMEMLRDIIKENEDTFDEHNIRNFIDAFLLEMRKETDESFTHEQLVQYVRDLFEAGSETTSSTLYWAMLCLINYPQTQDKLRKEIMEVIGSEGKVTTQKRSEMPYTCAFMEEVFRFRTLLPLGVNHAMSEDAQIGDYVIPKGTMVMTNLWAVHNDETLWKNPETFNPDRFLDDKGNFVRSPHVIPFSVGLRHCLGENLARAEFFMFLVSMVQKFEFSPDPKADNMPDIRDGSNGFVFVPKPYKLVACEL